MNHKHDAAHAAGVSTPQKEKAPSSKTEGNKVSECNSTPLAAQVIIEAVLVTAIVFGVLWLGGGL